MCSRTSADVAGRRVVSSCDTRRKPLALRLLECVCVCSVADDGGSHAMAARTDQHGNMAQIPTRAATPANTQM